MIPAASLSEAPDDQRARQMLETALLRLTRGARKTTVLWGIFLGISQTVPALRYLHFASHRDSGAIVLDFFYDLAAVAFILFVVWIAMPWVLRKIYAPLLYHGQVVPVAILSGPQPLHQRFTGQSTQPFMIRGSLGALELLLGGWLPTRAVNFKMADKTGSVQTGFLYPDETLANQESGFALCDPHSSRRIWLIRRSQEPAA